MQQEKTNTEHLRDLFGKVLIYDKKLSEEIHEFIDAIDKEVTDLNDKIISLEEEGDSRDSEIIDLEQQIEGLEDEALETIDCGIGIIEYRTDNLRLQMLMQEFKERQEYPIVK